MIIKFTFISENTANISLKWITRVIGDTITPSKANPFPLVEPSDVHRVASGVGLGPNSRRRSLRVGKLNYWRTC